MWASCCRDVYKRQMYSTVYVDKVAKKEEQKVDKLIRERMTLQAQDMEVVTPQALINICLLYTSRCV